MLRELFQRGAAAILAGEGEGLAERVKNVLCMFIEWNEKVEYEWATILLSDNSMQLHDFHFITCCWFFGSIRIICRSTGHNMQPLSLFYFFQLFSSITTSLLSALHLFYPHAFATNTNQSTRDHLAIHLFYIISLSQAILLLAYCCLLQR